MPALSAPDNASATAEAPRRRASGLFENSATNVAGLVLAGALGALAGLVVGRFLGPVGVGVLAVIAGIVEMGRTISNFSHAPSIIEYHRGRDPEVVFGTSLAVKLVGALAMMAVVILAAPFVASDFEIPPWALVLATTSLLLGTWYEIGTARLEAENRMVTRNLVLLVGPAVNIVLVATFALTGLLSVYTVILSSLVAVAAMSIGFATRAYNPFRLRYDRGLAGYYVTYGGRLLLGGFLAQALIWTDTLMISAIEGNGPTGVYNVAYQLTFVMVTASGAMGTALLPALSELAGRGAETRATYQRGTVITLGMCLVIVAVYVVAGSFILGLYGPAFQQGYAPLLVLLVFGACAALAVAPGTLLSVHGHAGAVMWVSAGQVALNIPLNYFLIHAYGILGASIATTVTAVLGLLALWALSWRITGALPLSLAALREVPAGAARLLRR